MLILVFFVGTLFAKDDGNEQSKAFPIKMQTRVGEAAINNVLMTYFGGSHEILVKDKGSIELIIKNMGIDIQKNKEVVFGYDMTIVYTFMPEKSEIHLGGNISIKGAISLKTVKRTIENAVDKVESAVVVLLDLNRTVEVVLNKHGITNVPVMMAIKEFFARKKLLIDDKIELWHQDYSSLLNAYVNKAETVLDLKITDMNLSLVLVEDNVVVNYEADIQSEKQYFWIDGKYSDYVNMKIKSNKEFQLINVDVVNDLLYGVSHPGYSIADCFIISKQKNSFFYLNELCGTLPKTANLYGHFRVKAKHGGILSFWGRIK